MSSRSWRAPWNTRWTWWTRNSRSAKNIQIRNTRGEEEHFGSLPNRSHFEVALWCGAGRRFQSLRKQFLRGSLEDRSSSGSRGPELGGWRKRWRSCWRVLNSGIIPIPSWLLGQYKYKQNSEKIVDSTENSTPQIRKFNCVKFWGWSIQGWKQTMCYPWIHGVLRLLHGWVAGLLVKRCSALVKNVPGSLDFAFLTRRT